MTDAQDPKEREMAEVERLLQVAAEDEREVLREAKTASFPEGEERIARTLAAEIRVRPLPRWIGLAAALAMMASLAWILGPRGGSVSPAPDHLLGGTRVELLAPVARGEGTVQAWGTFEVRKLVPASELPEIRILVYAGAEPSGEPIGKSPRLTGTTWTPDPAQSARWPQTICWVVLSFEPRSLLAMRVSELEL